MQKSFPRRNRDQIDNMDSTLAKFPNIGLRVCKELYDRSLSNLEKNSSTRWRQSEKNKAAYHQAARIGNVSLIELILRKSMDKSPKGDLFLLQHDNNMKENALKKFLKLAQILSFQKLPIWPTI